MKPFTKLQRVLVLFILLCFVRLTAQAQTEKGRWTAGVSIGSFTFRNNNSSVSLSPAAGYFLAPNFVVGTGVPLGFNSSKGFNTFYRYKAIGIAPFVRYYIGTAKLKPYLSFSYSYSSMRQRYNLAPALPPSNEKGYDRNISPSIGLAYFINRNVALNVDLSYHWYRSSANFTVRDRDNYANLAIGFQVFFGK